MVYEKIYPENTGQFLKELKQFVSYIMLEEVSRVRHSGRKIRIYDK